MACENDHLDDFPWVEFLHGGIPCSGTLRLVELGTAGRAQDVQLSCDTCGRRRRLSQAFGEEAGQYLPPRCRGRHPHLGITDPACQEQPLTLLLGASNSWFPVQLSALSIPSREGELAQAIEEAWGQIESLPLAALDYALQHVPGLKRVRDLADAVGVEALSVAIESRRTGVQDGDPEDLRTPEWLVFRDPDEAPQSADFKLRAVGVPAGYEDLLGGVVLVERLRRVSALTGFTRLSAPDDSAAAGMVIVPLARAAPHWLPCSEVRGEGIFLRLPEQRVAAWEREYHGSGSARALRQAHRDWRERRNLDGDERWPGERYLLLHSLAHALIRELALECGYTASSLRERIYASDDADEPMAGVLIYTAAPDSEGTLGGLVSLGEPDELGPLLRNALERLSASQVEALARAAALRTTPDGSLTAALAGSGPAALAAVSALAASWSSTAGLTGAGIALALRTGLRAQQIADATRSQPVWTGPGSVGEQRLTPGVLHELISGAHRRILLLSYAAHTVPSVAADLETAVELGCSVDVVFETGVDSSGSYRGDEQPFGELPGIHRWRWPANQRTRGSLLHAKALVIDGERALIGSANLTQRALEANLEVGVLVRDPAVAAALEAHVRN
jgi:PLD-like domain/Domain of unknown function (DUF1998)